MNTSFDGARAVCAFRYPPVGKPQECGADRHAELVEREAAAHDQGVREGEERTRQHYEQALERERNAISECVREFARERQSYYERVEGEVVQLALGIARKVLQREALIDPLLLAGAVRVALGRMQSGSGLSLRVSATMAEKWRLWIIEQRDLPCRPEVVMDPSLQDDQCVLESQLGSAALGVEAQLREIERGLFELLDPVARAK